jgi:hypothetical protein
MFHLIPALSLVNPITTTLREHFTRQEDTLLASLRSNATHITYPHTYKQAYDRDFTPRHTHVSLLTRLTPLKKICISTWPQLFFGATTSSDLFESCKNRSSLEGTRDPFSVSIRLFAAILTEPLNTINVAAYL